jgi:hypothetical protein
MNKERLYRVKSQSIGSLPRADYALLLMGGIGDFLHYLTKLPNFLREKDLGPSDLHIFVESVVPDQAEAIFTTAFPQLSFTFLSPAVHWVNTFPLLTPSRQIERVNRPAYRYVASLGFQEIIDWFLPFLCSEYESDPSPLFRLMAGAPHRKYPYVIISARDKGFIWWPTRELCDEVQKIVARTHRAVYIGTPNECIPGANEIESLPNVLEALALSFHADLFIGTDTGLATIRELTHKKNIYCISRFWFKELMVRYGYFDSQLRQKTKSEFVFNRKELLSRLTTTLDGQQ